MFDWQENNVHPDHKYGSIFLSPIDDAGSNDNLQRLLGMFLQYGLEERNHDLPLDEERKIIEVSDNYSMTGTIRMWALLQSIKNVIQNKIDGDIVECGVWKGGNLILSQKYLDLRNVKKNIYGFDTFGGMTEPEEVDVDYRNIPASDMHLLHKKKTDKENGWAFCSLADVNKNLNDTVPTNSINLIKGKVEYKKTKSDRTYVSVKPN